MLAPASSASISKAINGAGSSAGAPWAPRAFTGRGAQHDLWRTEGWRDLTEFEPDGIGYLGLGTLTGYTPQEMRAVPALPADALGTYVSQSTAPLIEQIGLLDGKLRQVPGHTPSPYQTIAGTLQGSFGHVGEIDTLVAMRARLRSS